MPRIGFDDANTVAIRRRISNSSDTTAAPGHKPAHSACPSSCRSQLAPGRLVHNLSEVQNSRTAVGERRYENASPTKRSCLFSILYSMHSKFIRKDGLSECNCERK
jgi:hypothetical protein